MERRTTTSQEVRLAGGQDDDPSRVIGYAAVYYDGTPDTEYRVSDDFVERIMPGSFDRAIAEDDVRALFNHDESLLLARTKSKTLILVSDEIGLRYDASLGKTQIAHDMTQHLERGDVSGSSFSFVVTDQDFRTEGGIDIREIRGVQLFDVGPVTYPAYEATTAEARDAMRAQRDKIQRAHDMADTNVRLKELQLASASARRSPAPTQPLPASARRSPEDGALRCVIIDNYVSNGGS